MRVFPAWMDEAFRAGGGKISVEEFMRLALYDPGHGYYSKNVRTVGRGGDFSTSATMHGALGEAIAGWATQRNLIEVGGGDGALAESVLKSLGWWRRRGVQYYLVETSEPLKAKQQERLGGRVCWCASVEEALEACGGEADIFSNELVDAFPAVALRYDGAAWQEVFVDADGDESFGASEFTTDWEPALGQRVEWHRSFRDWWGGWIDGWARGRMLTIDYGATFPRLYRRRPGGTLRAYFAQMRLEGREEFFQRVGKQDLTADVNFTHLAGWGESLGLAPRQLVSQREFLQTALPGIENRAVKEPALGFLLDETGAGGAFFVLEQERV